MGVEDMVGFLTLLRVLSRHRYGMDVSDLAEKRPELLRRLLMELVPDGWEPLYPYILKLLSSEEKG
jgi:hypothetical protein